MFTLPYNPVAVVPEFSGSQVSFGDVSFSGGTIGFSEVADWSHPPVFDWTDTLPPGVKLPKGEIDPRRRPA